jgi:hypothetical protein
MVTDWRAANFDMENIPQVEIDNPTESYIYRIEEYPDNVAILATQSPGYEMYYFQVFNSSNVLIDEGEQTNYSFEAAIPAAGDYKCKVKAKVGGVYQPYSTIVNFGVYPSE